MQTIWLFPIAEHIPQDRQEHLEAQLAVLLKEWAAHKKLMSSKASIEYSHFIVVQAFTDPSGCSIDWLQKEIRTLCDREGLTLLGNDAIFYEEADGTIRYVKLPALPQAIQNGTLGPDTLVYDQTVLHQNTLEGWRKPLKESWMARHLPQQA
mgnify:CR=1 FL=1